MEDHTVKIFFVIITLILCLPFAAEAAALYLYPKTKEIFVGEELDVSIFLDTQGEDVNAVDVALRFDPRRLQALKSSVTASQIEVWVTQPAFSNVTGKIHFIGGVPSPGINDSHALISTITFRAKEEGVSYIYFLEDSKVIRNDAQPLNILSSLQGGTYSLVVSSPGKPNINSETHPDEGIWYQSNSPSFIWDRNKEVTGFSYSLDQAADSVPDEISEGSGNTVSFEGKEGIWYFHVRAEKAGIWGDASHYQVKIDSKAPKLSDIMVTPSGRMEQGEKPQISLEAADDLSGMDYWEVEYRKDDEEILRKEIVGETLSFQFPFEQTGEYSVFLRAYDRAGNVSEKKVNITIFEKERKTFSKSGIFIYELFVPWWLVIIILLILVLIFIILWQLGRKNRKIDFRKEKQEEETSQGH